MTQKKQTNRIWAFVNFGRQTIIDGDSASFYNCMEDIRKQLAQMVTKQEFQQFQSAISTQLGNLQQICNNISDFKQKKKLVDKFDGMIQLLLEQSQEIQAWTQQISNINVQSMLDEISDVATQVKEEIKDKKENLKKQQTNLHNATQKARPNKEEILRYADIVQTQSPDDFFAKFCQALYSENYREAIDFIDKIDVEHLEKDVLKDTLCFLIKLMRREWITPASGLIERASFVLEDNEGSFRAAYRTPFEQKKRQIDENVYGIPTGPFVFVAYNSENVVQVSELVTFLEETPGIKCFVAFRNVENGLDSGEYIDKLHKAMENCSIFVLYSTYKSRNQGGSLEEMEYIMNEDYHRATLAGEPKYDARRVYSDLPDDYKKPRVEFVRETRQLNERDTIADKFFGTTTRRTGREELKKRILELLQNENRDDASTPEQSVKEARKPTGDTHKHTPKHSAKPIVDKKNNETTQSKSDINSYGEQKKESDYNKEDAEKTRMNLLCKKALRVLLERNDGKASIASIQRNLGIGFNRAGRIMDTLQRLGYVETLSPSDPSSKPLKVLITLEELDELFPDLKTQAVDPPIRYTITYSNVKGAANFNPTGYTVKDLPLDVKPIAKDGYSFVGWYVDEAMTKGVTRLTEQGDYVLYAKWIRRVEPTDEFSEEARKYVLGYTSDDIVDGCLLFTPKAAGKSYEVLKLHKSVEKLIIPRQFDGLPITSIGERAFDGCSNLKEITIPSSVTSIGELAFRDCTNLQTVTFEDDSKLQSIGDLAFSGCHNLQTVYYGGSKYQWKKIKIDYNVSMSPKVRRYYFFHYWIKYQRKILRVCYSNFALKKANRYYYSGEFPKRSKRSFYWHWDETKTHPVIWQ